MLEVEGLSNPTEFADISFDLRRGEILGFYGLVGAGRSETLQCLFGMTRADARHVRLKAQVIVAHSPADAIGAGIVYVPEERQRQGVVPADRASARTSRCLARRACEGLVPVARLRTRCDPRARTPPRPARGQLGAEVGELSGGNQQKVVIAKWLATSPRVIILDEPTKGIDVGSKAAVHDFMGELVAEGLAVIMVSSELPEIMGMSDRVIVMREGRIVADVRHRGA